MDFCYLSRRVFVVAHDLHTSLDIWNRLQSVKLNRLRYIFVINIVVCSRSELESMIILK